MLEALRVAGQAIVLALMALVVGLFSSWPAYTHFPEDRAQVILSISHAGQRKGGCRDRTPEELAALPPNMRRAQVCPRERVPLDVTLVVDGETVIERELPPTGIAKDGPAQLLETVPLAPGRRELWVRMRDSERTEGFDYEWRRTVNLGSRQNLAIEFSPMQGFVAAGDRPLQ